MFTSACLNIESILLEGRTSLKFDFSFNAATLIDYRCLNMFYAAVTSVNLSDCGSILICDAMAVVLCEPCALMGLEDLVV